MNDKIYEVITNGKVLLFLFGIVTIFGIVMGYGIYKLSRPTSYIANYQEADLSVPAVIIPESKQRR
jgi:hypothetical protein